MLGAPYVSDIRSFPLFLEQSIGRNVAFNPLRFPSKRMHVFSHVSTSSGHLLLLVQEMCSCCVQCADVYVWFCLFLRGNLAFGVDAGGPRLRSGRQSFDYPAAWTQICTESACQHARPVVVDWVLGCRLLRTKGFLLKSGAAE